IMHFDIENAPSIGKQEELEQLFSKEKIDLVYEYLAVSNDEQTIQNILDGLIQLKSFDYDGHKFKSTEADTLLPQLKKETEDLKERIIQNDISVFNYFRQLAIVDQQEAILIGKYKDFFAFDRSFDVRFEQYSMLMQATEFLSVVTPIEQIKPKLLKVYEIEVEIKKEIREMLESN
ncbi:hypothetical protein, partial [Clostridium vincentii]|uniref:hypothetical protein n=1 Tax=Clostridium vincentii TaxID=52704 RepID=UPI001A9A4F54